MTMQLHTCTRTTSWAPQCCKIAAFCSPSASRQQLLWISCLEQIMNTARSAHSDRLFLSPCQTSGLLEDSSASSSLLSGSFWQPLRGSWSLNVWGHMQVSKTSIIEFSYLQVVLIISWSTENSSSTMEKKPSWHLKPLLLALFSDKTKQLLFNQRNNWCIIW